MAKLDQALLGIDTGGTFTDFVLLRDDTVRVHKVLSRPDAPQEAILQGIEEMGLDQDIATGGVAIIHGTTVATNAVLEGKGVRTAYVTNRGVRDVLRIGRQTRPELYRLAPPEAAMPFDDDLMLEIDCRAGPDGNPIEELDDRDLDTLIETLKQLVPEAIAINLLFSFVDSRTEEAVEQRIAGAGDWFVCRSSEILPEYREYERGMTTWINAWIGPLIHRYLSRLTDALAPARVSIMQSSGLTIASDQAARRAVNLLLSGPAGGLAGSMFIGTSMGRTRLMTFDMGGTSSDVALLDDGIQLTSEGHVAGFPVGVPMADIHTIGAGGGSIAWIDDGGLLQVGPASAGADPGPACYGRGGRQATVTDANLVLGRLRPDAFLGGSMSLDIEAARRAIAPLADALGLDIEAVANGIVTIANEHMTQALRVISIQRGFDPRDFTLMCFGGAGGLHFCDLAENLEMQECIVPVHSGVLSALGMLTASPGREMVQTRTGLLEAMGDDELGQGLDALADRGGEELRGEGIEPATPKRSLDLRYRGQTFTLNIPFESRNQAADDFGAAHERLYGHRLDKPIELVNLRVHVEGSRRQLELPAVDPEPQAEDRTARLVGFDQETRVVRRETLAPGTTFEGPVLVTERHSTTLVKPGWAGEVDEAGNLRLRQKGTT